MRKFKVFECLELAHVDGLDKISVRPYAFAGNMRAAVETKIGASGVYVYLNKVSCFC